MDTIESIESAPKTGERILVYHDHNSDPYHDGERLTIYGAHCEGSFITHNPGWYIASWGGEYVECGDGYEPDIYIPDWWFLDNTDFEHPLAPTHWTHLPKDISNL